MLFKLGQFTSAAGLLLDWKIECDALTKEDWDCIAHASHVKIGAFGQVYGVPSGGWALRDAFLPYVTVGAPTWLIVDDVWTTGASMNKFVRTLIRNEQPWVGYVAFARGHIEHMPNNVEAFAYINNYPRAWDMEPTL